MSARSRTLSSWGKLRIPSADPMRSWSTGAGRLAAEPAIVPFGLVVRHQGQFGRDHPPVADERQVSAPHIGKRDVPTSGDLSPVFGKTRAQRATALCQACRRLADVDEMAPEVQGVDPASARPHAVCEAEQGTCLQRLDDLVLDAPVKVKIEVVRVSWHDPRILAPRARAKVCSCSTGEQPPPHLARSFGSDMCCSTNSVFSARRRSAEDVATGIGGGASAETR